MEALGAAVRAALDASENSTPAESVEAVTRELGAALGATAVSLLIADLSGRALVRLTEVALSDPDAGPVHGVRRDETESARVLPFDGGPRERALVTQTAIVLAPGDPAAAGALSGRWTVVAPISERGDAAGLLEMSLPAEPAPAVVEEITRVAHLLAFVLVAARRHTDLFEWGQRTTPFTLAAEIQHRLLPPSFTCEGGAFTLAGWLEPASSAGGDTFDYSAARDHLRFSLTDAMGHGVAAALAATLCVSSLRGTRRAGKTLLEQADNANSAVTDHAGAVAADIFVTGLLGQLDLATGELHLINAGHVLPFLAAADGSSPRPINLSPDVPFGMFAHSTYHKTSMTLTAGDRLVFVTDGMTERNAADLDLPGAIRGTRDLHPREAARALADMVLEAAGGELIDDATLLVLDWHDSHGRRQTTTAGTDAASASPRMP